MIHRRLSLPLGAWLNLVGNPRHCPRLWTSEAFSPHIMRPNTTDIQCHSKSRKGPQVDCPKCVSQFGQSMPTAWALIAQAVGLCVNLPLAGSYTAVCREILAYLPLSPARPLRCSPHSKGRAPTLPSACGSGPS